MNRPSPSVGKLFPRRRFLHHLAALPLACAIGLPCKSSRASREPSSHEMPPISPPRRVIFVFDPAFSHGYGVHEYGGAFKYLAGVLNREMPEIQAVVLSKDDDLAALDTADAVILGSDAGLLIKELASRLGPLAARGVGIGAVHWTLDPGTPESVGNLMNWIGGAYEQNWSINPFWDAEFLTFPEHPVARGLKPFKLRDEWYYHMRFPGDMAGVTPIFSAIPPDKTREGADGPHSGNPHVRTRKGLPEVTCWVYERPGGGRGFGFTGLHYHWNLAQDSFRTALLNAIAWVAGVDVPENGVPSSTPTFDELEAHLADSESRPKNFDKLRGRIERQIGQMNR